MTLTDPTFWDNYWKDAGGWRQVDVRHLSYDRCFDRAFRRWLKPEAGSKLIELGCAPGRWLIYFHQQFGYQVAGCDSAPDALTATRANLAELNVPGEVILADFMAGSLPAEAYDIVISLGVIEHFADPWQAIAQHVRLLEPGGTLVLEVPNYRGLNSWFLKQGSRDFLETHNTQVMRLAFFREIAARFKLTQRFVGYLGGCEPALWNSNRRGSPLWFTIGAASRLRGWMAFLDHVNHPFFSGYLMGIYVKGGTPVS